MGIGTVGDGGVVVDTVPLGSNAFLLIASYP
jgi:hypothetical protein